MKIAFTLLCVLACSPAAVQEAPPEGSAPAYTAEVPDAIPDTVEWMQFGDHEWRFLVTRKDAFPDFVFLDVLVPSFVCTERTLPCPTFTRFTFWQEDESSETRHVGRFVTEVGGRRAEGIARAVREGPMLFWTLRDGAWMPIDEGTRLYEAHATFYELLRLVAKREQLRQQGVLERPPEGPKPRR